MSQRKQGNDLNDDQKIFEYFMIGYWNQMAPDLYSDLSDALNDFRKTDGESRFKKLQAALIAHEKAGRFPSISAIADAYEDPFWANFSMIVTSEDIVSCSELLEYEHFKQ